MKERVVSGHRSPPSPPCTAHQVNEEEVEVGEEEEEDGASCWEKDKLKIRSGRVAV